MSKRKKVAEAFDEMGQPVESAPVDVAERKPKNVRSWSIQGITRDGMSVEVVAEGLTRGQATKLVHSSAALLRKLYRAVRLVKTSFGEQFDL